MKVQIEFDCDNAAFDGTPYQLYEEITKILKQASAKLSDQFYRMPTTACASSQKLLDYNGNTIGYVRLLTETYDAKADHVA